MRQISAKEFVGALALIFMWVLLSLMLFFMVSCSPRVVTVPEIHHEYHSHTDSVIKRDSVIDRKNTVIRELDSAAMAEYGIQLQRAERAWLVQTDQMRRELSELREAKSDTVEVRDTINVPYPVEVVKEPSLKDKVWWSVKCLFVLAIILFLIRFIPKSFRDS